MSPEELAEHVASLERATIDDLDEFLEDLLEWEYEELEQQNN